VSAHTYTSFRRSVRASRPPLPRFSLLSLAVPAWSVAKPPSREPRKWRGKLTWACPAHRAPLLSDGDQLRRLPGTLFTCVVLAWFGDVGSIARPSEQ
jgi:hypothetical protein